MKFTNNRDSDRDPFVRKKAGFDVISFQFRMALSRLETEVPRAASRFFHFPGKRFHWGDGREFRERRKAGDKHRKESTTVDNR
ncbi:hypothetical protein NPIL_578361 [Nephila pilipes]|uniref:Uncharacterized protein n=1 Tax=Nephila pilipes TaxID=299642 RepID=A0A8X6P6I2_NEPPI|nr:hypothetical protein NPIL_578361 [Nephila pilipes]